MSIGGSLGVIRVAFVFSRLEKSATQAQTGNLETATNRRLLFTDPLWKKIDPQLSKEICREVGSAPCNLQKYFGH
jgi:hypothetical protein